ncbi:hypothetical protein [Methylobacterium sp. 190mf]|uniref:DUF6894 family protein n=1 Tax=Methylobacterium sp. 190mf TaxID=1761798 RepID=UPI000CDF110D|nr:hypothetical protein [Methylobacterium sp. 190mf]
MSQTKRPPENPGRFRTECADFDAARREAMISLPDVARWEIPSDGDRQTYTVVVRDAAGAPIYTATLTFTGLRLSEAAG